MHMINEKLDALVVPDRRATERTEEKTLEQLLVKQQPECGNVHGIVNCLWGCYEDIDSGERFRVKRITIDPGMKLPAERHHHRAEHWVVVHGSARAVIGETILFLTENQSTYIPVGTRHRLENPGRIALQIVEVQSGPYLADDDAVRIEGPYQLFDTTDHDR
jgi:mannose-1-phosphate guanylyltransferase / mannose-6-phosphate isomerase